MNRVSEIASWRTLLLKDNVTVVIMEPDSPAGEAASQ